MPHVMLKRDWPGHFRRTVYRNKGKQRVPVKTLEFKPGEPVDLTEAEMAAVAADIGPALQPVSLDEKHRPRVIELEPEDVEALEALAQAAGDDSEP